MTMWSHQLILFDFFLRTTRKSLSPLLVAHCFSIIAIFAIAAFEALRSFFSIIHRAIGRSVTTMSSPVLAIYHCHSTGTLLEALSLPLFCRRFTIAE